MQTHDFYFAGELFDAKHLTGNAYLAAEILKQSEGKFRPVIPQDLEQRSLHPHDIRDEDILALIESDLALFHFDGQELDSGTVVEFMIAKFADIPSVIVRSDFRASGDQAVDPWNLMVSFYPRTEVVLLNALSIYKSSNEKDEKGTTDLLTDPEMAIRRAMSLNTTISKKIITAFEKVSQMDPLWVGPQQEQLYEWLQRMCNFRRSKAEIDAIFERILKRKQEFNAS